MNRVAASEEAPPVQATDEGLVRSLGVRSLAANNVNLVIGSGIFVLPAAVAAILGPQAIVAYVLCAAGMALLSLCFAELGSRVTRSGGTYAYVEAAFGPRIGFLAGFLLWFGGGVLAGAAVGVLVIDSLLTLLGIQSANLLRAGLIVGLFATLAITNIRGVRTGARLVEVLTVAKLAPLVVLILLGLLYAQPDNLIWSGSPTLHDYGRAILILVFVFSGTEGALYNSGEVKKPETTVPRAIFLALLIITSIYVGVHLSAQGLLGSDLATEAQAPLAAAAGRAIGPVGSQMILIGMLISTMGYMTGSILAIPRSLFAFSRDGSLPRQLSAVHPRFRTPHVAIITHSVLACALGLTGTFEALAVLSVLPTLVVYGACCLAVLKLRGRDDSKARTGLFRAPGGPFVPLATLAFVCWLFSTAKPMEAVVVVAIVALAFLLRTGTRRYERNTVASDIAV